MKTKRSEVSAIKSETANKVDGVKTKRSEISTAKSETVNKVEVSKTKPRVLSTVNSQVGDKVNVVKTKSSELTTAKVQIGNKANPAKTKFTNSLRESISNEKNKVSGNVDNSSKIPKPIVVATKAAIASPKAIVKKVAVKKLVTAKVAPLKKITTAAKTMIAPKKTIRAKPIKPKSIVSAKPKASSKKTQENFKDTREEFKSSPNTTIFDWPNEFKNSYAKILQTMNEDLSDYINNIAHAGNMQNLTKVNMEYFDKIKKWQNDLLKESSSKYLVLLSNLTSRKK